jgi:peptidoglycan/xylan/chitin deacetylase (PgdA/CDA1 family)
VASPLRRIVAAAARGPVAGGVVAALDRIAPRRRGVLTILTYHRVDDPGARPDLMPSLISATPAAFADQMALVARAFDPVGLADVLDALDRPERLPPRAVLLTFDDGYADFQSNAWPVLKAASLPATLFVATGFAAEQTRPYWWDRLWSAVRDTDRTEPVVTPLGALPVGAAHAAGTVATLRTWLKELDHDAAMAEVDAIVGQLGEPHAASVPAAAEAAASVPAVLGWDALRTLAAEGVTLAPHTRNHPLLDRIPLGRAVEEIGESYTDLVREIGETASIPRALAYPSGSHGGSAVEAARQARMELAFTTDRGGNDLRRADRLRLRRINVGARASTPLVRAQLAWAATIDARRGS